MLRKAIFIGLAPFAILTGCDDGASGAAQGSQSDFVLMRNPCMVQATRLTGVSSDRVAVTGEIQTSAGPLLTLDVGGTAYGCRTESDGSVSVFSNYAT